MDKKKFGKYFYHASLFLTILTMIAALFIFKSDGSEGLGGLEIGIGVQYSMEIKSDIGVVVQYGRLDVQQPNMAYMALMAQSE